MKEILCLSVDDENETTQLLLQKPAHLEDFFNLVIGRTQPKRQNEKEYLSGETNKIHE
jgi:hypothetical protein